MAGTQAKRSSIEYATGRVGSRTAAKTRARVRRHLRVRKKVSGDAARPRLVVNRSAKHIFVQIVDDTVGRTLASASTLDASIKSAEGDKTAKAKLVGALDRRAGAGGGHLRRGLRPWRLPVPRPRGRARGQRAGSRADAVMINRKES